jgi:hypothetical protein
MELESMSIEIEEQNPEEYSHKVLFLNSETLEVTETVYISPPFTLGIDSLKTPRRSFFGILAPYVIVEKDFNSPITQEILTDFQREIALKVLEDNYKKQQMNLMSEAVDYDEYSALEIELKKKYFDVKKQIMVSPTPLLVDSALS